MTETKERPSISVIVPAYNEEKNIAGAVKCINSALGDSFSDHEIIILNDHSTDATGAHANALASKDDHIRVVHNPTNMGFGYNYKEGVRLAEKDYVIMVPGDNEIPEEAIRKIFTQVGGADVIVPYTANMHIRPMSRQLVSKVFTKLINIISGLDLQYFNGTCVLKSEAVKAVEIRTHGFAYMATILSRLLRSGCSYIEIGVDITQREGGESKAFAIKNVISVVTAILGLAWELRVTDRAKYNAQPKRIEAGKF